MGNVASAVWNIITAAIEEFVISILDIFLFLAILFGLTLAAWVIAVLVRLVFLKACSKAYGAGLGPVQPHV